MSPIGAVVGGCLTRRRAWVVVRDNVAEAMKKTLGGAGIDVPLLQGVVELRSDAV